MKHEIQEYKGQTIYYDETFDKFVCDISIEDAARQTKRNKLEDVRKEIDQFIKVNLEFKPFKALRVANLGDKHMSISLQEVRALRSNGTFVVGQPDSKYTSFIDRKEVEEYYLFNQQILDLVKSFDDKLDQLRQEKIAALTAAVANLHHPDLSKYSVDGI